MSINNIMTTDFFRILSRDNSGSGPVTDHVEFTMTVTGPNIMEIITVDLSWSATEQFPSVSMTSETDGSAGSAAGLKYLRLVYPKTRGTSEPWSVDAAAPDTDVRSVQIVPTVDSSAVTWANALEIPDWEADYNTMMIKIPEPSTGSGGGSDEYVPLTRTVNGKALSSDINLKTSDLENDSGFITSSDIPEGSAASTTTPKMDGVADVGSEMAFARGDHRHPSDTSKLGTSGDASSTTVAFTQASSRTNISSGGTLATAFARISKWFADLGSLAFKSTASYSDMSSGVQASLDKADSALQSITESDPTVPSWAKQSSKPSYTASEVGAVGTSGDASSTKVTFTQASSRTNISSGGTLATAFARISKWLADLGSLAFKSTASYSDLDSGVQASLDKADSALQSFTESDPTVPNWAKQSSKPSYTASEVGALPDNTVIPSKTSDLQNDSGFITSSDIPEGSAASTTTPKMDGVADVGSEMAFARGDHRHPSDTSKLGTSGDASSTTVAFTQASSRTNISSGGTLATAFARISKWFADLGSLAFKSTASYSDMSSGVQASLDKADSALQSFTESDPTVPSWAKQSSKPSYTASEVGAVGTSGDASSTKVTFTQASSRTNISSGGTLATAFARISKWLADLGSLAFKSTASYSDLDSGVQASLDKADSALQSFTESDPTVPNWAKQSSKPTYTYSEVGAAAASHSHSDYAGKTTITTATISASGWSNGSYSALQTSYPAASYDLEIEPDGDTCTAAQQAAWSAAKMIGSATTNVLKAMGTVPTVDIPIIVKVTPK